MTPAEQVADFNARCPVGAPVTLRRDSGEVLRTTVKYEAQVNAAGDAVVWVNGVAGCYLLERVRPEGEPPAELPAPLRPVTPGDRPYRRSHDWPVQRGILEGAVPEYYSEARALYGDLLPDDVPTGDLWDNRTAAENAVWLIERLRGEAETAAQLRELVSGHGAALGVAPPPWDGRERRKEDRRRG